MLGLTSIDLPFLGNHKSIWVVIIGLELLSLNTDYADFQHMVDKAIVIESKIKEMEKDGKRKVSFSRQSSGSNVRPRFS
jgi:hypothetical protein